MNQHSSIAQFNHPLPVSSKDFGQALQDHWTAPLESGGLGNKPSDALRSLWEMMGQTYSNAIASRYNFPDAQQPFRVIQCPTGSAKTQGVCLYAAMTAKNNHTEDHSSPYYNTLPIGVLIVVRLIEQADEIAATINRLAGFKCAVAAHSDNPLSYEDFKSYDVLVITHKAYTNAVAGASKSVSRYDDFLVWEPSEAFSGWGYKRLLVVVDEALANVVQMPEATLTNINKVLLITDHYPKLARAFREEVKTLEAIRTALRAFSHESDRNFEVPSNLPEPISFDRLADALKQYKLEFVFGRREDVGARQDHLRHVRATLDSIEVMLHQWRYFSRQGRESSMNTSKFLIPEGLTDGAVFLDATAANNFLWELIDSRRVVFISPKRVVRDYSNVTLHVARDFSGLGHNTFEQRWKVRVPRLVEFIRDNIEPGRKVLIVTHKSIRSRFGPYLRCEEEQDEDDASARYFLDVSKGESIEIAIAHYGAVDGRNEWSDFDTVFLFGLPYLPQTWSYNVIFAVTGFNRELFNDPSMNGFRDYPRFIDQRQMATSIIQAINRIRTRRVIDEQGRCAKADVYLWLPWGGVEGYLAAAEKPKLKPNGLAWLEAIRADMPGIKVAQWEHELDGAFRRLRKTGGAHAIVEHMRNRLPGETTLANLKHELGITDTVLRYIKPQLEDSESPLSKALAELGVKYVKGGRGRGNSGKLVKG